MRRARVDVKHRSWFRTALETTGLGPMTIHDLHHTAASLAVSAGANVKAVQRMLGHASAAITLDECADLFDDDLNAVSDRLDKAFARTDMDKLWASGQIPHVETKKKPRNINDFGAIRGAEPVGFEPTVPLRVLHLSRVVH